MKTQPSTSASGLTSEEMIRRLREAMPGTKFTFADSGTWITVGWVEATGEYGWTQHVDWSLDNEAHHLSGRYATAGNIRRVLVKHLTSAQYVAPLWQEVGESR